jgi:hypothetical protein
MIDSRAKKQNRPAKKNRALPLESARPKNRSNFL